jgi:tellurite resistance protein
MARKIVIDFTDEPKVTVHIVMMGIKREGEEEDAALSEDLLAPLKKKASAPLRRKPTLSSFDDNEVDDDSSSSSSFDEKGEEEEEEEVIHKHKSQSRAQVLPVRAAFKIAVAHAFDSVRDLRRRIRTAVRKGRLRQNVILPRDEKRLIVGIKETLSLLLGHGSTYIHNSETRSRYARRIRSLVSLDTIASFFRRLMDKIDEGGLDADLCNTAAHYHGVDYLLHHRI